MDIPSNDVLSDLLVAQLIAEDLRLLASAKEAERLQIDQVLAASAPFQEHDIDSSSLNLPSPSDADLALELYALDARLTSDAAYAESLQVEHDKINVASRQYAQKLAATEIKIELDAEFARKLQDAVDNGTDADTMKDADNLLGPDAVERILAANPNDKGKGKGKAITQLERDDAVMDSVPPSPYPICGICMEPFLSTNSPISASRSANSSERLQFGLHLPCPKEHSYCISCLTNYIQNKIDPEGDGSGSLGVVVFPIRCPECPLEVWTSGIDDGTAAKVLSEKGMIIWHHQKLLDSLPRFYCPNAKCSVLVQVDENSDEPQVTCPSCQEDMCVPCRVPWHNNLSCEQYQAIPLDERSPDDLRLMELAKAKHWRRCPNCARIVELVSGCNHITCICGTHFCFKCGAPATTKGKCTRQPSCELWDEEMLLEENERVRAINREQQPALAAAAAPALAPPPVFALPPVYAPPPYIERRIRYDGLDWLDDENVLCRRHWFTVGMVRDLTCGYCDTRLNSLADLRYHLAHVTWHPVYACCGRFFKREVDFTRHQEAYSHRFGGLHVHEVNRR